MLYILYPSGSHGSFLKLLFNELTGVAAEESDSMIYDRITYRGVSVTSAVHILPNGVNPDHVINIQVRPESYLKYFAVCLNRTSGHDIVIEDLHQNTFDRIKQHSIVSYFSKSLSEISGQLSGDVDPKFLREWFRLCFFANQGETITKFIAPNVLGHSRFVIDFESFYNGHILDQCMEICKHFSLPITHSHRVDEHLVEFQKKNRYHNIDLEISAILDCIENQKNYDLTTTNILQQAWVDNHLVNKYNINPLLKNDYFRNTLDLSKAYNL